MIPRRDRRSPLVSLAALTVITVVSLAVRGPAWSTGRQPQVKPAQERIGAFGVERFAQPLFRPEFGRAQGQPGNPGRDRSQGPHIHRGCSESAATGHAAEPRGDRRQTRSAGALHMGRSVAEGRAAAVRAGTGRGNHHSDQHRWVDGYVRMGRVVWHRATRRGIVPGERLQRMPRTPGRGDSTRRQTTGTAARRADRSICGDRRPGARSGPPRGHHGVHKRLGSSEWGAGSWELNDVEGGGLELAALTQA